MTARQTKILTSKFGKKFSIGKNNKPVGKDGVIWLTYDEWDWIKSNDLDSKQFDLLLQFKIENHHHEIITDEHRNRRRNLAIVYCENIKDMLRGKKSELTTENIKNEKLHTAPGKLPESGAGEDRTEAGRDRSGWEKRTGENIDPDGAGGSSSGEE